MASILIYSPASGYDEPLTIELAQGGTRTLAQIIWTDGRITPPPLCSGLGRCGRCRIQFLDSSQAPEAETSEAHIVGLTDIEQGWRLACRHSGPVGSQVWKIVVPEYIKKTLVIPDVIENISTKPCLLAVDLGTTSLHWEAVLPSGETVATACMLNPQMGAGSDVMSRIAYAMTDSGRRTLRRLLVECLCQIKAELRMQGFHITELCIAGNTAMTAIAADISVASLAAAPYAVPFDGNAYIALTPQDGEQCGEQRDRQNGLPDCTTDTLPKAWIPPQVAPFIGGDISAGYVALCQEYAPRYPFLLADLGTNGEFVLALSPEKSLVTSVPLGPALEGIGLRHGTVAAAGVITKFSLGPTGLVPSYLQNDDGSPAKKINAISGTGYLSLISTLLRAGILDEQGTFVQSASGHTGMVAHVPLSPLAMRIAKTLYRVASPNDLGTQDPQRDCQQGRELQLADLKEYGELRLPLMARPQSLGFSSQQRQPHVLNTVSATRCANQENTAHHAYQGSEFDLSGSDMEEILKVKAAFSLAVAALLKAADLPANSLDRIYIAGALGLHIMPHDLEGLGFLPTGSEKRITAVGNTSRKGAKVFLLDHETRALAQYWATTCTVLDLTQDHEDFTQNFLRHMRFRF
ncbi:MAG: ASKHA domain-containing protein [Pseudomonadota bacterium]